MDQELLEAIQLNEEKIELLQSQIQLMKSIDFTKPVDEKTWHEICETPLRRINSSLLAKLVQNIFQEAEDIVVHANYVYFNLLGFKVQIPVSCAKCINVDTSWYKKDNGMQNFVYISESEKRMKEYFKALDAGENWWTLANLRLDYRKWFIPFAWWFKYKWKDPHREEWELVFSKKEAQLEAEKEAYNKLRKEMHDKALKLKNELLPLIDKFSDKHCVYDGRPWYMSVKEIIDTELGC